MKKVLALILAAMMVVAMFTGCALVIPMMLAKQPRLLQTAPLPRLMALKRVPPLLRPSRSA